VEGEPIATVHGSGHASVAHDSGELRYGFDPWLEIGTRLMGGTREQTPITGEMAAHPFGDWHIDIIADWMENNRGFERKPLPWLGTSRFCLTLSHDVDRIRKTFQIITHPLRHLLSGKLDRAIRTVIPDPDAYWSFPLLRRLEENRGVRSTFFVLPGEFDVRRASFKDRVLLSGISRFDSVRLRSEVLSLHRDGWEIGLHSSNSARENPEQLWQEKGALEGIIGQVVPGVRQHFLAEDFPRLWLSQSKTRFSYDSSMGFSDRVGFRGATAHPYEVSYPGLWELPFEIMDGGLPSDTRDAWRLCLALLDEVEAVRGALVILWHQRFFNERDFPGKAEIYCRLIDEARARGAWIAPCGKVLNEWRKGIGLEA